MKLCPRCGIEKPSTSEYFYRNKQTYDGLHSYCKICKSNIHKEYRKNPFIREKISKEVREWQKGIGKEKYTLIRKRYDTSEKRKQWRHRRYIPTHGRRDATLQEALECLERIKRERGLID
jgi:hypothetical protein